MIFNGKQEMGLYALAGKIPQGLAPLFIYAHLARPRTDHGQQE